MCVRQTAAILPKVPENALTELASRERGPGLLASRQLPLLSQERPLECTTCLSEFHELKRKKCQTFPFQWNVSIMRPALFLFKFPCCTLATSFHSSNSYQTIEYHVSMSTHRQPDIVSCRVHGTTGFPLCSVSSGPIPGSSLTTHWMFQVRTGLTIWYQLNAERCDSSGLDRSPASGLPIFLWIHLSQPATLRSQNDKCSRCLLSVRSAFPIWQKSLQNSTRFCCHE